MPPLTTKAIHFGPYLVTNQVFHLTPHSFALVNLKPLLPGHVLVSPLRSVSRFSELTPYEITDLFMTVQRVSRTLQQVYDASSFNVAIQDGVDAGQTVPHVHAHVIPRKEADMESRGGGDKLYELLESEEGDVGGALKSREKKGGLKVDADEDRKPRSEEDMAKEAEMLAYEMAREGMFEG